MIFTLARLVLSASGFAAELPDDAVMQIYATHGQTTAIGTGFLVNPGDVVATAYHVVMNSRSIDIIDRHGNRQQVDQIWAVDPVHDLALLHIPAKIGLVLPLVTVETDRVSEYRVLGNPNGISFQMFSGHATQNGFLESRRLNDEHLRAIFGNNSDIPLIPLDITSYGGLSGAPLIDENARVVGVFVGSLNTGHGLSWAIPVRELVAIQTEERHHAISDFTWPPFGQISENRSLVLSSGQSIAETLIWINEKWAEKGKRSSTDQGFDITVNSDVRYEESSHALLVANTFSRTGDTYRYVTIVTLPDAESSHPRDQLVQILCPKGRNCVHVDYQKKVGGVWKVLGALDGNEQRVPLWSFVDVQSAQSVSRAINHLIHIHGGPVKKVGIYEDADE